MRRLFLGFLALSLCACTDRVAEFWRPISEPNILLPLERAQVKLTFDLSQCQCGIFPTNTPQSDLIAFDPDKQRLTETGITITNKPGEDEHSCVQRPSLVVAECMRARGWEVTKCTGRMPIAGGGAICAGVPVDE
jgi:hypothetical protein